MADTLTIKGFVANEPKIITTKAGDMLSFRIATNSRKFNKEEQKWQDGHTNWYNIIAFNNLCENGASSILKGDPLVVSGDIKVSPWEKDDKKGVNIDIVASSIGHDLNFGTNNFKKKS